MGFSSWFGARDLLKSSEAGKPQALLMPGFSYIYISKFACERVSQLGGDAHVQDRTLRAAYSVPVHDVLTQVTKQCSLPPKGPMGTTP
jgi:hypothetical protein